ncbi:MAG: hypothetical protein IJY08_03965 [Clostridia bacterium]|nr:hypothetical protein [Clostridia bacterium]
MIGNLSGAGGTLTFDGCTITQSGGRGPNGQFCKFGADNTTLNMTNTTFMISMGGRSGGQAASIFKIDGAYTSTINLTSSRVGFTSDAQFVGAVTGILASYTGSTLNLNMKDSTLYTRYTTINAAGDANIDMSGESTITLDGPGSSIQANAISSTNVGDLSIKMNGNSKIETVGTLHSSYGVSVRAYDGTTAAKTTQTEKNITIEMSGKSSIVSGSNHAVHIQHGTVTQMAKTRTCILYDEATINATGKAGSAINVGEGNFTLYLDGNAKLTKNGTTSISALGLIEGVNITLAMGYTAARNHVVSGTHDFNNNNAPTVVAGASVRTVKDSTGIRFTADVTTPSSRKSDIEYGMIVARYNDFNGVCNFMPAILEANGIRYATASASDTNNSMIATKDGKKILNFAITGLEGQESTQFAVRGYTKYNYSSSAITCELLILSDFVVEDNVRSIEYVAGEAVKDVKDAPDGDYQYEVVADCAYKGKYSRYSSAQYDVVLGFTD